MRFISETIAAITVALSGNSAPVTTSAVDTVDLTVAVADVTPADFTALATGVDVTENTFAKAAHGLTTGTKITAISSDGALPTGVSGATVYYIIAVDAGTFQIATSQANALAGTEVDITNAGSGTDSFDVTATLAGSVKLQKNVAAIGVADSWVDVTSSSQNFSAAGNINWTLSNIGYRGLRYVVTTTSGVVSVSGSFSGKSGVALPTGGTDGQVLTSDGAGSVSWETAAGGATSGSPLPTATCTAGALQYDTAYLYVCAATDVWGRISLVYYCSYVALLANPTFCTDYGNAGDGNGYCALWAYGGDAVTCAADCAIAADAKYASDCL